MSAEAPVTAKDRFGSLDVLRGFALCGILLINITWMGSLNAYPPLPARLGDADWTVWFIQFVGVEGTMRGLFTLLFGAGVVLITRRDTVGSADVYLRRCMMLMAFGLVNVGVLLWPGDVLWMYGVSGLFLFVFRKAPPKTLLALAAAILMALTVKAVVDFRPMALEAHAGRVAAEARAAGHTLSENEAEKADAWTSRLERQGPDSEWSKAQRKARTTGWPNLLKWSWDFWSGLAFAPYAVEVLLDTIAYMMIGMALFRMGVLTGEKSWRVYALMAAGGYAVALPINIWEGVTEWNNGFLPDGWIIWATYQIGRLPMTVGHLGLVLLLWKTNLLGGLAKALGAIGRLALTNYLGQAAIGSILFYGFGLWDRLGWAQLWMVAAGVWAAQAVFSLLYLRFFAFGPAEWLLRAVAYGRRPPLRLSIRESAATE